MFDRLRRKLRETRGFTLLEMILVVGIISVVTSLASVGIYGYMVSAYMNRVNETAKTVFLAAQNYLTQEKQMGKLTEFNDIAENFGGEITKDQLKEILKANDPSIDFDAYQNKYGTTQIRYILLNEGDGTTESDNPIYHIIKEYLGDETLLEHTFLMEYDAGSGVVRSIFYTEKAGTFSYSGDRTNKSNVILRGNDVLKQKRQGYHGVSSTSLLKHNIDLLSPSKVKLVNGERLYLEWKEANYLSQEDIAGGMLENATEAFDDVSLRDYIVYDVEVFRTVDGTDEKLFTLKNINPSQSSGETLAAADGNVTGDGIVLAYQPRSNTYQLVLDDLHHSILDMYDSANSSGNLQIDNSVNAADMLYCKVSERLTTNPKFEGESEPTASNQQSANYAGGAKTFSYTGLEIDKADVFGNGNLKEDGTVSDTGKAFSVANVRHLNNMRNASNTSCFVQTADIDWIKPETDRTNTIGLFAPLKFASYMGSAEEASVYQGIFRVEQRNGVSYKISNLSVDCLSGSPEKNVGMFRQNKGTIRGLSLLNPKIKGGVAVGAVTGINGGTIENITIDNGNIEGSYYVGGIAGKNVSGGNLINIQCDAAVTGNATLAVRNKIPLSPEDTASYGQYIGGIAGYNQAKASNITNTILGSNGKPVRILKTVTGSACVGGIFGGSYSGAIVDTVNNYSTLKVLGDTGGSTDIRDFGGIVGLNEKDSQIISGFNKTIAFQEKANANPKRIKNIGGIAGTNKGLLKQCKNIPDNSSIIDTNIREWMNAVTTGVFPVYSGVNVGGIAGINEKTGTLDACLGASVTTGYRMVGGLAGENRGDLKNTIVVQDGLYQSTGGFVAASSDCAGGIVGSSIEKNIEKCINRAIVFAGSSAGGIAGANGGSGEYSFTQGVGSSTYYDALLKGGYQTVDSSAEIKDCENYGFVYALNRYSGGITGMNYGKIVNSNSSVQIPSGSILTAMTGKSNYQKTAKADCVGGIAGCSTGSIVGGNKQNEPVVAESYGKDCVGGVVGLNKGSVKEYARVMGNVYASGNFIGGFLGMNLNGESVENLAFSDGMQIYAEYFAGGIVGLNISDGAKQVKINGASTQASDRRGLVNAKAYAGGIIGYQTTIKGGISDLYNNELKSLIANAYAPYEKSGGKGASQGMTVFSNCINRSEVQAERYAGGIVGYNSNDSGLLVTKGINYGRVEIIKTQGKVTDGFYFVGGITGRNSAGGIIDQSVNDGSVISPSKYLGGICEVNEGYVQFCVSGKSKNYNDDGIKGDNSVGGLVGLNSKHVVRCSTNAYAKISGGDNTGGLVGTNDKEGIITGDISYAWIEKGINEDMASKEDTLSICAGSVAGKDNTGGIVGRNEGRVEDVSVENATVSGDNFVGGFIGNNMGLLATEDNPDNDNVISGLVNNAQKVVGVHQVGGIVGKHNAAKIENCINQGTVEATGSTGYAGGITGSVENDITIEKCTNYGTVISKISQAGGIVGNNKGVVKACRNYGSVSGSDTVNNNSAIGGITGVNEAQGLIDNCVSGDNQKDLNKKENPNIKTANAIRGVYIVGGMVGINRGTLLNDNSGKEISIDIILTEQKLNSPGNIGGVLGVTESKDKSIRDYTYSGEIQVPLNASQNQFVGGIIGRLPSDVTMDNCVFAGKITGYGNAEAGNGANSGIGGLAGYSDGTLIVNKNKEGYYAPNTTDSSVEGCMNIGGVVGITGGTHKLQVRYESGKIGSISMLPENMDSDVENDTYFVNLSSVAANKQGGGFYGRVLAKSSMIITYLQNGVPEDNNAGNIRPNKLYSTSASSLGGITGSLFNGGGSSATLELINTRNYGTIGHTDGKTYMSAASNVGGIVGQCMRGNAIYLTRNNNYGTVTCGNDSVGGIAGRAATSTIMDCYNNGSVITQANKSGGVTGYIEDSSIILSSADKDAAFNKGEVTIEANVSDIGGIAGLMTGNSSINGVQNKGSITCLRKSNGDSNIGGIVGRVNGTASITGCYNQGNLVLSKVYTVGGIVGVINASNVTLRDCSNQGSIKDILQDGGGIVGKIQNTPTLVFQNNTNTATGEIYGKFRIGGLIGIITSSAGAGWAMSDSVNDASIHGILPEGTVNGSVSQISGGIGYYSGNPTVTRFTNNGNIVVNSKETTNKNYSVSNVSQSGGVFGYITSGKSSMQAVECVNNGDFLFDFQGSNASLQNIGGVAGVIFDTVLLDTCVNTGEMDFSLLTNSVQSALGGIMGGGGVNTKLTYCVNKGSILGAMGKSNSVGGVAGTTNGLIYSCSTERDENGKGTIQGETSVGGIVGAAGSSDCKVASIANKEGTLYVIGMNQMTVQGRYSVGGIVGSQRGATVYSMVNSDKAEVILMTKSAPGGGQLSGGGITGSTIFDGNVPGVIANCYNFGKVIFEDAGDKSCLGGIIGVRNQNQSKTEASASIKDSFYLYEEGTHDLVDISQPNNGIPAAVLAVGNEPEGSYFTDAEDQEFGDSSALEMASPERFRWSKSAYEKMYRSINGLTELDPVPDSEKWDQMDHVIGTIVKNYNKYKLPVPKTGEVTSEDDYRYVLPIEKMPGFCSYLEINLYPENTSDEEIKNETAASLLTVNKEIDMDFQLTSVGFDTSQIRNYKDYVGQVLKVSVKAHGVGETLNPSGEIIYTSDSDNKMVQQFVLMPVLEQPKVQVVSQEGSVLTFAVTNWSDYLKSAGEFYESIKNNPALNNLPIYQSLKEGLESFTIKDYYLTAQNGNRDNQYIDTWTIQQSQIDANGVFTIDYSKSAIFNAQKANRQWHDWDMQAVAMHRDWSVEAASVVANDHYRYTSSYITNMKFQIQAVTKMKPPTQLTAVYTGDIDWKEDPSTPQYEITFKKSESPEEAVGYYLLTITNPSNGKTHTVQVTPTEIGTDPDIDYSICNYVLDKDTLLGTGDNQLGLDLTAGSQPVNLSYSISTQPNTSDAAKFFAASDNAQATIPDVKKQYSVNADMNVTIENANKPNELLFHWTDDHSTGSDVYLVSYAIKKEGVDFQSAPPVSQIKKEFQITLPTDNAFYEISLTVVKQGVVTGSGSTKKVESLNSDPVTYVQNVGKQLEPVTNVKVEFKKIEGTSLFYDVTFDVPAGDTTANCKGFMLEALSADAGGTPLTNTVEVPFSEAQPIEVEISTDKAGNQFYVYVTALTSGIGYGNSPKAQSNVMKIPTDRLTAPINLTSVIKLADGSMLNLADTTAVNAMLPADLKSAVYSLGWSIGSPANVKCQQIVITDGTTEIYSKTSTGNIEALDVSEISSELSGYPGKELKLSVYNLPLDPSLKLPSLAGELSFYVPKIQLVGSTVTGDPLTEQIIIDNAGVPVTDTDEILPAEYGALKYIANWNAGTYYSGKTSTKLTLFLREPDGAGGFTETQVMNFGMMDVLSGTVTPVTDGIIRIPCIPADYDAEGNPLVPLRTITLTGIDASYAEKEMILRLVDTGETDVSGTITPSDICVDSEVLDMIFKMPKVKITRSKPTQKKPVLEVPKEQDSTEQTEIPGAMESIQLPESTEQSSEEPPESTEESSEEPPESTEQTSKEPPESTEQTSEEPPESTEQPPVAKNSK